jgi:hypothetical protein
VLSDACPYAKDYQDALPPYRGIAGKIADIGAHQGDMFIALAWDATETIIEKLLRFLLFRKISHS